MVRYYFARLRRRGGGGRKRVEDGEEGAVVGEGEESGGLRGETDMMDRSFGA
jgi:hypothetical protein